MRAIGILLVMVGCDFSSSTGPGDPGDDAQHGLGMFVDWHANPTLPGDLTEVINVSSVTFQLDHFQIVADAGNVTRTKYQLTWDEQGGPDRDKFPDAPPGVYSKLALVMMGGVLGEYAYQIRGTWRDNGLSKPFEIHDRNPLTIALGCDETLAAGGAAMVAIKVDLRDAISEINFRNADEEDGVLEIHDGLELDGFRSRLPGAFSLDH